MSIFYKEYLLCPLAFPVCYSPGPGLIYRVTLVFGFRVIYWAKVK